MNKYGLESCSVATFHHYNEQQKIEWALSGVRAERFHYTGTRKAVVCQCVKSEHLSLRRVQNPEIQELCAIFFMLHATELTCAREQWRAANSGIIEVSPATVPATAALSPASVEPLQRVPTAKTDSFEYDSTSVVELLEACEMAPGSSRTDYAKTSSGSRTRRSKKASCPPADISHLGKGSDCDGDIPEDIWRVSRPSVYLGQHDYEDSLASTPLGSSVSTAPAVRCANPVMQMAELPLSELTSELDSTPMYSRLVAHHSPTLRELEGRSPMCLPELEGRPSNVQSMSSKTKMPSIRDTQVVGQPSWDGILPNQEDFFLRHVTICSRENPMPPGDCSLCQSSYQAPDRRTIRITCGHFVHQECLMTKFRELDLEFGNCSVCGMAMCERGLDDQIDTDREAIFGSKFTLLATEERIDFLQRGRSVVCGSEEEVAATQLRLLKDYVDFHAQELYRQWRQIATEPDWYGFVVSPVVQLFQGWNLSTRACRYFADHEVFYKMLVWAELVRLMNTTRNALRRTQGEDTPFPRLSGLHRNFLLSKDRYETEKQTWSMNQSGALDCEIIAQDAFSAAVCTRSA